MFRLPKDTEMTIETLDFFLGKHREEITARLEDLQNAYKGKHEIFDLDKKASWKPDNRIAINFPKYIADTFDGFAFGNPVKITADDEAVSDYVEYLNRFNDQDDNDAELFKICSIFGNGYEMYYADEDSELCTTYLTPLEAFMIYDDSIVERPMFFVRRYKDWEGNEFGSISNKYGVRRFSMASGTRWTDTDWQPHNFADVPATEYIANDERQGIFEGCMSAINAYNKAISEKANDVDYFADAYLKILGAAIDGEDVRFIRDNRIINLYGDEEGASNFVAEFMGKPNSDTSQENLLDRLERLIFQIAQVANISDENFGGSSGIALKYKVLSMHNLSKTRYRKAESGMNRRYRILFSHPAAKVPADSWVQLAYQFTPNIPANLLEEAQIAAQLEGITSHATQLTVLSCVDNVQDELDKIEEENKPDENTLVDKLTFGAVAENAITTEEPEEQPEEE